MPDKLPISFSIRPLRDGILVWIAALACALSSIWWIYSHAKETQLQAVRADLQHIAQAAATILPGDLHEKLASPSQMSGEEYRRAVEPLVRLHRSLPEIKYLYTLVIKDGKICFVLDTAAADEELKRVHHGQPSMLMDVYTKPPPEAFRALRDGVVISMEEPRADEFGMFLTGYAPIHDSQGRRIGVVCVDISATDLNGQLTALRWGAIKGAGIALVFASLAGFVVGQLRRRALVFEREHARAEDALHAEETRHSQVLNNLREVVFQTDVQGRWSFLNPAWKEITGFPVGETTGKTMLDFVHDDDAEKWRGVFSALNGGERESCRHELRFKTASGDLRWFEVNARAVRDEHGAVTGTAGTLNDITKRKKAERALLLNEERLKLSLWSSDQGLWDWSIADGTAYYDPQWANIHGHKHGELRQSIQTWKETLHPDDRDRVTHALDAYLEGHEQSFDVEYRALHSEENWIWVHTRGRVIDRTLDWKAKRMIGTIENITERKLMEAELVRMKQAAEAADRAKGGFLAVMSHEIRTPLNGVIGFADILGDTKLDPHQQDFVGTIRNCAETLLVLINDILDFSKIESTHLELESVPFNIRACLDDAVGMCAHAANAKRLELVCDPSPDVPDWLCGDPTRLRQILVNLITNAVKFTEHGEVVVSVTCGGGHDPARPPCVIFDIRDTGIGIPADRLDRLFKPFSQADSSTTRRYGGTGLGLAICKRLVELMDGVISVQSTVGAGSVFSFTVPLAEAEPPEELPAQAALDGLAALVVDDNDANRQALGHILRRWGMRVVEKSDAPSALEYLRSDERFDIALLDLMMPGMDGIELTRAMRAFLPPAALPVIMASSFSQRDAISQARAAGVQATMNKPVRQSQLHDTLLRVLTETGKFSLPETGPDHPPAHVNGTLAVALGAGLPLRILVAEDQPVNQRIVNLMLKKLGYAADIVGTGREAADAVRVREYDVVLMDMHMPVMDGFEAAGEIRRFERETGRSTGVHIIALTADALDGDREKCLAQGMNDYLSKPLHPKDLRSALQRYAQT